MNEIHTYTVELVNQKGLHARAAAKFVKTCEKYIADVFVAKGGLEVPALSIMGLMMLAAQFGSSIEIKASGPEAPEALDALRDLIKRKFDEEI